MSLTQKDIEELKEIYRQEFGEDISNEEAWEMGRSLIQIFSILAEPISEEAKKKSDKKHTAVRKQAKSSYSKPQSRKGQLKLF